MKVYLLRLYQKIRKLAKIPKIPKITLYHVVPSIVFLGLALFDELEEQLMQTLLKQTRKILQHELRQPSLINVGHTNLKYLLNSFLFENIQTRHQTAALVAKYMLHEQTVKMGNNIANNMINQRVLKQMAFDLVKSYQRYYNFDNLIPDNFK